MSRRPHRWPVPTDWHLWVEVKRSVTPLRARPEPPEPQVTAGRPEPGEDSPAEPPALQRVRFAPAGRAVPPATGLEPALRRRLERGRIEIDARIDLHGLRQAEAHAALTRFLALRAARGDRTVLVITGKGGSGASNDEGGAGRGVLRAMLPIWLGEGKNAALVAGWEAAARVHGGEGAFYVRLRRADRR